MCYKNWRLLNYPTNISVRDAMGGFNKLSKLRALLACVVNLGGVGGGRGEAVKG